MKVWLTFLIDAFKWTLKNNVGNFTFFQLAMCDDCVLATVLSMNHYV